MGWFDDDDEEDTFAAGAEEDADVVANLTAALLREMATLFRWLPDISLRKCEFQLYAAFYKLELNVLLGSALWSGTTFQNVTPFSKSVVLLDVNPPRRYRYVLYGVAREPIPHGIRYTYVFPHGHVQEVDVDSVEGRARLLVDLELALLPQLIAQVRELE